MACFDEPLLMRSGQVTMPDIPEMQAALGRVQTVAASTVAFGKLLRACLRFGMRVHTSWPINF